MQTHKHMQIRKMILYCKSVCNTFQLVELSILRNNMELEEVLKESDFLESFADIDISSPLLTSSACDSISSDDVYYSASEWEPFGIVDELEKELREALEIREKTTAELLSLKREIEESYDKSRKAKIGGAVAAVTGSALGILGFGLAFVTFGASLSLMVVGGAIGAAGGTTVVGADIGYTVVSKERMKKVKVVCQKDENQMQHVRDLIERFKKDMEKLRTYFPHYTVEQLLELILRRQRSFSNGISLLDGVIDIGRAAVHASDAARIGSRIAIQSAGRALALAGRVVGVVAVALDVILLPIDIYVMVTASIDVHKYQGGRGESRSCAAREIGKILETMGEQTKMMKNMHDSIKMFE